MAREIWAVEMLVDEGWRPTLHSRDGTLIREIVDQLGSGYRAKRYVPEDKDALACLASIQAALEALVERHAKDRLPAELTATLRGLVLTIDALEKGVGS